MYNELSKPYSKLTNTLLVLIYILVISLIYSCDKQEEKATEHEKIEGAMQSLTVDSVGRLTANVRHSSMDSFIYVPVAYGAYMFSRIDDINPGRGNTYLTHLRRESGICKPRRYGYSRYDVDVVDTLPFRKTDSFFICRKVKI